jgi:hypothetical protein
VFVLRRLVQREHGRDAGVAAGEDGRPFFARLLAQARRDGRAHFGPDRCAVLLGGKTRVQARARDELGKELRLQRRHRKPLAIGRFVAGVERGAAVQQVGAARAAPLPGRLQTVEDGHQRGRAVDHRRIHHLAAPGCLTFEKRSHHAEGQVQRPAAIVAHQVQRRKRRATGRANGMQRTGQRDVVQVVPGGRCQRPLLAEAGHAPVDQARVARLAFGRAETHALGRAGAKTLQQHIGRVRQAQHGLAPGRLARIDGHRAPAAQVDFEAARQREPQAAGRQAVDEHHVRAQVGEQLPAQRHRADAGQLDDPQAFQGPFGRLRHDRSNPSNAGNSASVSTKASQGSSRGSCPSL